MLKNKFKMIVVLFTIIALVSAFCITVKATDATPVVTSENVDTTNEVSTTTDEQISNEETHEHEEDEILYEDLYIFDDSVTMDKIVDGNVYIFGNNVKITGKVNGNLFVFGNEVTFTTPYAEDDTEAEHQQENYCYVAGSIFACANKISFNGIAQDIYAFSNTFDMSYESYIMRDIRIGASDITLKGYITRDAYLYADTFDFGTSSENEEEDDSALIAGNLNYSSSKEAEIPESIVKGETKFTAFDTSTETKTLSVMDYILDLVSVLVYTLVIYLLLNWLMPKFFEKSSITLKKSALSTFGIGILAFLVTPMVALILLCLTLFPLSLTLATVYGILLAISFTVVAGGLTLLLKDKLGFANKKALLLVIVTIVLWALKQIPFVGSIITVIISIFGLGIIIKNIINRNKPLELKEEN